MTAFLMAVGLSGTGTCFAASLEDNVVIVFADIPQKPEVNFIEEKVFSLTNCVDYSHFRDWDTCGSKYLDSLSGRLIQEIGKVTFDSGLNRVCQKSNKNINIAKNIRTLSSEHKSKASPYRSRSQKEGQFKYKRLIV